MIKHSELPWTIKDRWHIRSGRRQVASAGGYVDSLEESSVAINQANAEYIFRACNAFPALVEALKTMLDRALENRSDTSLCINETCRTCRAIENAQAALALARGEDGK